MARVEVPYVQRFKDRHGKVRHYFRHPKFKRVPLPDPADPTFAAAYHQALAQTKRPVAAPQTAPGTIGALLVRYYLSDGFRSLKPITQANYKNVLERFRVDYGHNRVADFNRAALQEVLAEKVATPTAARNLLKRIRTVLDLAVDLEWVQFNVAKTVKFKPLKTDGFVPWSDEEIEQFEERWAPGTRERRAMYLLLYTGQRRSDASRMGRQHVKEGRIKVVQEKGGATLWIPIHPKLKAELDLAPKDALAFVAKVGGIPFTYAGFTNWFVEAAKAAGLVDRTPHGLRKSAGRKLAEAGCTVKEIMAILGHKTMKEAAHYTESADQERLAKAAMRKLTKARS